MPPLKPIKMHTQLPKIHTKPLVFLKLAVFKSSQNHTNIIPHSSQKHTKIIPTSSHNYPKIILKLSQTHPNIIPYIAFMGPAQFHPWMVPTSLNWRSCLQFSPKSTFDSAHVAQNWTNAPFS